MAKRLRLFDKQGNPVVFDIGAASVTIDAEGKSLDVKLSELVAAIASSVKSVTFNGNSPAVDANGNVNLGKQMNPDWNESNPNWPSFIANKPTVPSRTSQLQNDSGFITEDDLPEGVECDTQMSSTSVKPVQNKVIKAYVDNLINGLIDGAPAALDTLKELAVALSNNQDAVAALTNLISSKANASEVVKSISVNGTPQTKDGNGNVDIDAAADVSVTTNNNGTFTINVGDDSYTINLNHTHENMAKLEIVDEEPANPARDTIYALVNDAEDPSEIQSLWIAGLEFAGGGGTPLLPSLTRPADGSTIPIGYTENGSVSAVINIKGKRLTQPLVVEFASGSTGYSFDTNDATTNSYYDNNTGKLTIPAADANSVNGVDVVVKFTGNDSDMDAEGVLGISSSSVDGIDADATLVANPTSADGLIGHWDGDDAAQSGAWVDQVNSMKLNLGGSASKTNDGYRLDNTSAPKNAWLYLDSADKSTMNSEIGKEFTCIVDCLVKFSATGMIANIIDFGALGTSLSNASVGAFVKQAGELSHRAKSPANTSITATVNNEQIPAFTTGTYVPMRIFCGAKLVNGVQRFFARFGAAEVYSDLATPVAINFSGCTVGNTTADYAFAAGIAYLTNSSANSDTPNYKADVIYERILLFNKTL